MTSLLIRNGTVLTFNQNREIIEADLLIQDGRIAAIPAGVDHADQELDAAGSFGGHFGFGCFATEYEVDMILRFKFLNLESAKELFRR